MNFIERLKKGETFVCDGAMGTSLQEVGLEQGCSPEEWNISEPDKVKEVHKGFIGAGCDMLITNTFGANPIKLKRAGLENRVNDINKKAVEIARNAIKESNPKKSIYVLGDIGPTGDFLTPIGQYAFKDFYEAFLRQAEVLYNAGIDAFIIETMSDLSELEIAISACRTIRQNNNSNLPIIASVTFAKGKNGHRTIMGSSIKDAVNCALGSPEFLLGCDVIGANCGCGSKQMVEIMKEMKDTIEKIPKLGKKLSKDFFLIAQPNAGMPRLVGDKTVFDETPEEFAKNISELVNLGVSIIGGCCGTTPAHIAKIVEIINNTKK